jgi:hypothetical protein
MVASIAKMSRPRPELAGVMVFARARKASTSAPLEGGASTAPASFFTGGFN